MRPGKLLQTWSIVVGLIPALSEMALGSDAEECARKAAELGRGTSSNELDLGCAQSILEGSPASQNSTSPREGFSVAGFHNVIALYSNRGTEKYDFIAGPNTGLHVIESLAISKTRKEVWILNRKEDGSKDLRIFISRYGGNLSPIRVFHGSELAEAALIQVSQAGDEAAIWFPSESVIRVLDLAALKGSPSREHKPKWKRTIKMNIPEPGVVQAMVWVSHKNTFALLSLESTEISLYRDPMADGTSSVVGSPLALKSDSPLVRLYWSEKLNGIQAVFKDGTTSLWRMDP